MSGQVAGSGQVIGSESVIGVRQEEPVDGVVGMCSVKCDIYEDLADGGKSLN